MERGLRARSGKRAGSRASSRRGSRADGTASGRAVVLLAAAALVAACGTATGCGDDDVLGPGTDPDALRGPPAWELLRIERADGTTVEPVVGPRGVPSLTFTAEDLDDGRRFDGDTGCNAGGGAYLADDDGSLELLHFAWTEMACLEPGVMAVEQAFQDAMATVHDFRLAEPARLVLEFDGGEMVFEALVEEAETG